MLLLTFQPPQFLIEAPLCIKAFQLIVAQIDKAHSFGEQRVNVPYECEHRLGDAPIAGMALWGATQFGEMVEFAQVEGNAPAHSKGHRHHILGLIWQISGNLCAHIGSMIEQFNKGRAKISRPMNGPMAADQMPIDGGGNMRRR